MLVVPAAGLAAKGKDSDRDGLSDRFERSFSHTKPQDGDSDADGLDDGQEVRRTRTNPRRADTDKDGLSDGREIRIRTDPRDRDTDGDGLTDGSEVNGGTVFNRPFFEDSSFEASNPRRADTDRDGLSDRSERRLGTSPVRADSDGDGYSDYQEVKAGTDPLDPNSPAKPPPPPPPPPPSDTTPPDTAITAGPSGTTASTSAEFTFTSSETSSSYSCRLDGAAYGSCGSPKAFTGLAPGTHTFDVRASDLAGNTDASAASRTWTVSTPDSTPPETAITAGPSGSTAATTASFSFSSSEAASTFECRIDAAAYGSCSSPKAYAGLAVGSHTFDVRATDAAGNADATAASRAWTVTSPADTTAPDTSISAGPSGTTSSTAASVSFASSESGSSFECRLDGSAWGACSSPKAYSGLAGGSHSFDVRAIDAAGNVDATPASRAWSVDASAPDTSISAGPSGTTSSTAASVSFASSESGSTFECRLDSGAWAACASPKAYSGLAGGSHSFEVRAIDAAGNVDATPASRAWTIDASAPDTSISAGPDGHDDGDLGELVVCLL